MFTRWVPWKFLIKRTARAYGIIDPVTFLAKLRRFAQPSEVQEPLELLRAGIVFHARGLINTKAIQHNLDWVWPYWVERQFSPRYPSFIPRAFSFSHVNLTQRNWTAVGRPDVPLYPIVDPRGMVTPLHDGWSLDFWLLSRGGRCLFPSRLSRVKQIQDQGAELVVRTECRLDDLKVASLAMMELDQGGPQLKVEIEGLAGDGGWVVVAIRPYNRWERQGRGGPCLWKGTGAASRRRWKSVSRAMNRRPSGSTRNTGWCPRRARQGMKPEAAGADW